MQYLSRNDIEQMAGRIIDQYKQAYIPDQHMCYNVDIVKLASLMGYEVEYVHITKDGSILGKTSSGQIWTRIYDDKMNELYYLLDGHTILVDKRLLASPAMAGRKNFTIAHELAHQIINRTYPGVYGPINATFCDHRRSVKPKCEINDWHEWQADALAAALLLPLDAIESAMFMYGLGNKMKVLSRKYSQNRYESFCCMAQFLGVSKTTLAYRMEQLGLLERNYLIEEAQQKRGVVCNG